MRRLTLIANLPLPAPSPAAPAGYTIRPYSDADVPDLARLQYASYDPGIAYDTVEEALQDYEATFAGAYGEIWPDATLVAVAPDGSLAAAILTVRQAPWDETPAGPFVIELYSGRSHRRLGLARTLLHRAAETVAGAGLTTIALRVDEPNLPARALYESLGFKPWRPPESQAG